jgi:hypothetical protein
MYLEFMVKETPKDLNLKPVGLGKRQDLDRSYPKISPDTGPLRRPDMCQPRRLPLISLGITGTVDDDHPGGPSKSPPSLVTSLACDF